MTTSKPIASVVDIFCGAGGLSFGFKQEGFEIAAGVDVGDACMHAYTSNLGASFLTRDVASLTAGEVSNLFNKKLPKVLVGCAPCQPFSSYNQKNKDPNWALLSHFGNLIATTSPDVVSMENVPRLLDFRSGSVFRDFVDTLQSSGYRPVFDVLYGPDFGLAQTRSHIVLIAAKTVTPELPLPTHKEDHRTVNDEIGNLPVLKAGEANRKDPLHKASALSETNLKRIRASRPGGTWRDWPKELVASCHKGERGKGYSGVYGRMDANKPSPTITTQFYGFGNGRFGHPKQHRALSLREGAMLQGFPQDYSFAPKEQAITTSKIGRMIGNAVPVPLARAIARSVRACLEHKL